MAAPLGNKFALGNNGGRPTRYRKSFHPRVVQKACEYGLTDAEISEIIDVPISVFSQWKLKHQEFREAIKAGHEPADDRVERSLYHRAIAGDVTACIFWLKNRRAQGWSDRREVQMSHDFKGLSTVDDIRAAVVKELGQAMADQFMAALEAGEPELLELKAETVTPDVTPAAGDEGK